MLMGLVQIRASDFVTAEDFMKQRNSAVSDLQRQIGRWSLRWASRMVSWDQHLRKEREREREKFLVLGGAATEDPSS